MGIRKIVIIGIVIVHSLNGALQLTSPVFKHNGFIPEKYTCDGDDVSPPLEWSGVPAGTKSFALIVEDPDALKKVWVHWVVFNIPAAVRQLPEDAIAGEFINGSTDFNGILHYTGPCPPQGVHRYNFTLYALDIIPNEDQRTMPPSIRAGASKRQLVDLMRDHTLDSTTLTGRYARKK